VFVQGFKEETCRVLSLYLHFFAFCLGRCAHWRLSGRLVAKERSCSVFERGVRKFLCSYKKKIPIFNFGHGRMHRFSEEGRRDTHIKASIRILCKFQGFGNHTGKKLIPYCTEKVEYFTVEHPYGIEK
jgi:hypothetical protein